MVWWVLIPGVIAAALERWRHPAGLRPGLAGAGASLFAYALLRFVTQVLGTGWPALSVADRDPRVIGGITVLVVAGALLDVRRPTTAA